MDISFSKLESISLKEQAVRELENKILSGELKPGERLPPERDLALALGISRSLVNLCILELESKGFVRIVPRQGTFVNDYKKQGTPQMLLSLMNYRSDRLDWSLFDNLMDTRRLLEYECTRLAIRNATEQDLAKMTQALQTMVRHERMEQFILGNFSFHLALAQASANAVYAMILNSFRPAMLYFLQLYFSNDERRDQSIEQHQALLDALVQRHEPNALDAIKRTLDMGIEGLGRIFKQPLR